MAEEIKQEAPKENPAPVSSPSTQSSSSGTSSSGSNKGCTTAIIIIVVILVILGVGGYFISRYLVDKVAEKGAETLLDAATGAKVDIDGSAVSVKTGDGNLEVGTSTWPSSMPSDVPKYSGGSISYSSAETTNKLWSVGYSEIPAGAYDSYKSTLTAAGWTMANETDIGLVKTGSFEKGSWSLTFSVDAENSGATLSVSEKL